MTRVVHLFANHKLTGPAELALDTARFVHESGRVPGASNGKGKLEGLFVPGWHPNDPEWVADLARERGVRMVEEPGLHLSKHFYPVRTLRSALALRRYLRRESIDLVHCHMPNDHLVATIARSLGTAGTLIPIVRTIYDGEALVAGWRQRWTLGKNCDHLVYFSQNLEETLESELGIPPARRSRLDPPIDTTRFQPDPAVRNLGRQHLGIDASSFVVGIVARMQTHRRFEILLDSIARVAKVLPDFRFVIIGRGTHQERVAFEPVRQMGLDSTVIFSGYRSGDDYVATLQALDAKIFLVPGSDGTCRAVRESLACGIPLIAANRGMLSEIVRDGETGKIIEDTSENLANAMIEFAQDRDRLKSMALKSREDAESRFSYERYIGGILDIYAKVLGGGARDD
jgi:glycosyltransferase involved in cell wall biosynthesis